MIQNKKTSGMWRIVVLGILLIVGVMIIYFIGNNKHTKNVVAETGSFIVSTESGETFSDGLQNSSNIRRFEPDDSGAGITEIAEYTYDINNDGRPDRITRSRVENGTVHFQYVYKIELNDNEKYVDITPRNFYTVEGAECALQKLQFSFKPDFSETKITRPMADDWNTPTQSTKTVFALWNNKIHTVSSIEYKTACDVSELY